ncbi:MAG: heme biosynthesis protein HemY [Rhodobacteraceae bacterium]|nr:heme biosynthesis protein HemY [Paracoccaceae bacterium]
MIWSLIKVAIFIALAAALALGAAYLQDTPGEVRIAFGGQEISLTPLIFVLGSLVAFAAFWLLLKLAGFVVAILRFIKGDKTAFSRFWDKRREARGYRALADGMVALASGEGKLAAAKAAKAEKLLAKPELTRLISAQAAEMAGDRAQAIEIYKGLLENDRTRFVGVRGLMKAKLDEGDEKTALKLAEKAFALKPRHKETLDTLFGLQTRAADWGGARKTLLANSRAKLLPKDIVARRDAVLSVAEAMVAHETGDMEKTRDAALFASRNAPALVPAAILAAQVYISGNTPKHGMKVLKKAWETNPHPDLGAAFAAIRPDETPEKRIIRFQPLLKLRPDHPETAILATGLHLAAEDFPAARRALGDLPELAPTGRTLGMMAAIAKGEGAPEEVVRGWLARAVSAPRGEAWVCSACHSVQAKWAPLCSNCEGFDTLGWTLPAESENPVLSDAMLPLIERPAPEEIEQADPPEDVSEEPLEEVDTIATEIPENKS